MTESKKPVSSEYERERIPASARKGASRFWGMYAGEHAAGTEFMIGPLFLLNGVSLQNIILGLLVGNFLAVLSWRFICAPIATGARYTLYYHLEKLAEIQPLGSTSSSRASERYWTSAVTAK